MDTKSFAPWVGVAVLVVVAGVVFVMDRGSRPASEPVAAIQAPIPAPAGVSGQPVQPLASPVSAGPATGAAPGLEALVGRIEEKVKADPSNVGNRILLAQTYGELGRVDDGIVEMRKLYKEKSDTGRTDVVLASLLIKRAAPENIIEAEKLLDAAQKRDATQAGFVYLYRGRAMIAQGKTDAAVKIWNEALAKLPAGDGARAQIEDELSKNKQG